jgi:hypothetical protein
LTSALEAGEWSASRPGHFTPRERAPGTLWIGGWVGPRAVLDAVVQRNLIFISGNKFRLWEKSQAINYQPLKLSTIFRINFTLKMEVAWTSETLVSYTTTLYGVTTQKVST